MLENLTAFLGEYAYFTCCLIGIVMVLIGYGVAGNQRRMMIVSGLVTMPLALLAIPLVGEYWSPSLLGGWIIGIEDFLFVFCGGSMTWLMATWPFRKRITVHIETPLFFRRYVGVASFAVLGFLISKIIGLGPMTCMIVLYMLALGLVLALRMDLWPIALSGAMISTVAYIAMMSLFLWLFPVLESQFGGWNLWGPRILGYPIEEFVTACSSAAAVPTLVAFASDVSLTEPSQKVCR